MSLTIRQHKQLHSRGRNDLLEQAYKDLGRAAFHRELIVVAVFFICILLLGAFA